MGKRCSVIQKETLFQMSLAWTPRSPKHMAICRKNISIQSLRLGLPPQEYVSAIRLSHRSDGHPFLLSVFAVRLMEIRLCLPSRAQQSRRRPTSPGDFHHIRFGHPSRRHPCQPSVFGTSVSAFRLEDVRLTHLCRPPSRGQPSRQIKIKYFNQPS